MKKIKRNVFYDYYKDGVNVKLTDSPEIKAEIRKREKIKKSILWSVLGALIFVFVLNILILPLTSPCARVDRVLSYDGDNPYIVFDERAMISAHRAGGDLAPEETLAAFELCLDEEINGGYRVDILEFDLHMTKDGYLVLLHDHELDRTSDSVKVFGKKGVKVKDKTLAELKTLNMGANFVAPDGSMPYKDKTGSELDKVRILELNELLAYVTEMRPDKDIEFIIEIKDGGEHGKRAMDELYRIMNMEEYGKIIERTIVGTFQGDITKHIDKNYSDDVVRSASIEEVLNFYYAFLWGIDLGKRDVKYEVLQIPYKFAWFNFGTQAVIDYAHSYGLAVQFWTINEPEDVRQLILNGADAIMTDDPKMACEINESMQKAA